jgi:hypothetical protein
MRTGAAQDNGEAPASAPDVTRTVGNAASTTVQSTARHRFTVSSSLGLLLTVDGRRPAR